MSEKLDKLNLSEHELNQVRQLQHMYKKLRTFLLKRGYKKLKKSNKRSDIIACYVVESELNKRGKL